MAFGKKSDPRLGALDDLDKMLTNVSASRMKAKKSGKPFGKKDDGDGDVDDADGEKGESPADEAAEKKKHKFPPRK